MGTAQNRPGELPLPGLLEGENPAQFSKQQAKTIKDAVKKILRWKRDGFPGGQPVSLSMQNVTGEKVVVVSSMSL